MQTTLDPQVRTLKRELQLPPGAGRRPFSEGGLPIACNLKTTSSFENAPMTLAIETHHLTRHFGDFCAVSGVELAVERGTFYGFLGPNGAGKSTTIKMLTGLLAPSGGQVLVLGKNMLDPRESLEAKRSLGVIPEDLALFDNLTAREYLTFVVGPDRRASQVVIENLNRHGEGVFVR